MRPAIVDLGLKPGKVMHVLYTAIEGTSSGLPLFDSIALLGRERSLAPAAGGAGAARRRVRRLAQDSRSGSASLGFAVVFLYLSVTFVQVWMASRRDEARPSQAIIVLGAAQYNGRPSPVLAARLDHAIELYRKHIAPVIVVTGGREPGDRYTEAGASAEYLHQHGIVDTAILRETTGRTSWESLEAAARFLDESSHGARRLVSDPYHSERIEAIAHDVGLDAVTSPTRTSPIKGVAALQAHVRRDLARRCRTLVRIRTTRPPSLGHEAGSRTRYTLTPPRCPAGVRARTGISAHPFGGGVIGNTTGSGPVIGGSIPPPRADSTVTGTVSSPSPGPVV